MLIVKGQGDLGRNTHIISYSKVLRRNGVNQKLEEITPFLRSNVSALGMKEHLGVFR